MNDDLRMESLVRALDRMTDQAKRIATALEEANRIDPLAALAAAMDERPAEAGPVPAVDPNADMPPHIKRTLGLG